MSVDPSNDSPDRAFRDFLARPREGLAVELKQWIDPSTPEGTAKIARACIALRNNNGGRLIIGFRDNSSPDVGNAPADPHVSFSVDAIQAIVSRYSADPFAIDVQFYEVEGQTIPVIIVPPGVRTPVAAKADLRDPSGKLLVRDHAVYVRSVQSNNIVSSTEARRGDWETLIRICFENREADIGGFVRRHLSSLNLDVLRSIFPEMLGTAIPPSAEDRVAEELDRGRSRFEAAMNQRKAAIPNVGFRESAIIVDGQFPRQGATETVLRKLLLNAPSHTGWPPWLELPDEPDSPYVLDRGWQALLLDLDANRAFSWPHLDFWRIEPSGVFYQLRAVEDDLAGERGPTPGTQLDFLLQISRLTEILLRGLSFGRSLGCDEANTSLVFGFRWSGLLGRHLTSWVEPMRSFYSRGTSNQDQLTTVVALPLETSAASISPYVEAAVKDLFALFGGMEFETRVIESIVAKTASQRM